MPGREHAERLWANLLELGPRRLIALALIGLVTLATVGFGAYYLSRPQQEVLYTGLDKNDVGRIGSALKDAGIPYDVSPDGETVLVNYGATMRARMLLAERGLPRSGGAGYELFDDLGSLGLTSFMQEVTRVRAIEGELARTIQSIQGVTAARVHIVMPEKGSFRRQQRDPSASVVLRTETPDATRTAEAIRHLVAAAVPGMTAEKVTVLDTTGALLASGGDQRNLAAGQKAGLEEVIGRRVSDNIRKTLTPYLGIDNFQVSVAATLNTDRQRINQTIYDPESRTERSVRIIRQNESAQNASNETPTTVQQNLPGEEVTSERGERSSEENERREETVNYEISTKTIEVASDGYAVEHLSVAVLVDRARLAETLGGNPTQQQIDNQIADIEQLVASAAGIDLKRGDMVKVSVVDFIASGEQFEAVPSLGIGQQLVRQFGTVVNALTILAVAALVVWFGLRPAMAMLMPERDDRSVVADTEEVLSLPDAAESATALQTAGNVNLISDLTSRMNQSALRQVESLVELNDAQSAAILKQWMYAAEGS